jgi:4'-phosphopantetheinyl transferase
VIGDGGLAATERWPMPPARLSLDRRDVHVWRCSLDLPNRRRDALAAVLSPDELTRAARPYSERGRHHAIVARGFLRMVLARYSDVAADKLSLVYGDHGKPALAEGARYGDLRFNLSHSGDITILAVTRGRDVGVDVERLRPIPEYARIAARFFSPRENADLLSRWADDPVRGFFTCWTRKEAYIKATGDGLSQPLDGFDVALAPDEPARLLRVEADACEVSRWSFDTFEPAPGYLGAVAAEGDGWRLVTWSFDA